MRVNIDPEKCQGHARCAEVSSLFVLGPEGFVLPRDVIVPDGMESEARQAVTACPERALNVASD
ncbi:MAG: hypothetical protein JWM55_2169 [Acidimicrobiaceae bacterium]|nr:hypothetical protein [Acidimicrobiaceae bacterium]